MVVEGTVIRHKVTKHVSSRVRRPWLVLFALAISLAPSLPVVASGSVRLADLVSKSDFIIVATVVDSQGRLNDTGVMVFTDYAMQVEKTLKGNFEPVRVMSFAGGEATGRSVFVTHVPQLRIGDTYLILGYKNERLRAAPVVGWESGIFRIVTDAATSDAKVVDYNWYQLSVGENGKLNRGPRMYLDDTGALVLVTDSADPAARFPPIESVVRDAEGNEVQQVARYRPIGPPAFPSETLTKTQLETIIQHLLR